MKLVARKSDNTARLLLAKIGDNAILQSYSNEEEYIIEPSQKASGYYLVKELKPFKYGQKVMVSNDEKSWYPKEFVVYLPERNKFLCRDERSKIYFQRQYCKGITTNDEEHTLTHNKKQSNTE